MSLLESIKKSIEERRARNKARREEEKKAYEEAYREHKIKALKTKARNDAYKQVNRPSIGEMIFSGKGNHGKKKRKKLRVNDDFFSLRPSGGEKT